MTHSQKRSSTDDVKQVTSVSGQQQWNEPADIQSRTSEMAMS